MEIGIGGEIMDEFLRAFSDISVGRIGPQPFIVFYSSILLFTKVVNFERMNIIFRVFTQQCRPYLNRSSTFLNIPKSEKISANFVSTKSLNLKILA